MNADTTCDVDNVHPIREMFAALRERDELGLIAYLTAGFPSIDASIDLMHVAAGAGADLLEIGVPFSDPIADGPTIQFGSTQALAGGFTLAAFFDCLARRPLPIPTVLFSYLNPLLAFGRDALLDRLVELRIAGLIVPDLPVDEAEGWLAAARERNLILNFLVTPTTTDERLGEIATKSAGFIYAVSTLGTTGARRRLSTGLPAYLQRVRNQTQLPIAVGFGISTPGHITELRDKADAVVIGSRFIDAIRNNENLSDVVRRLKSATRGIQRCTCK